jgi:hypothetical protein
MVMRATIEVCPQCGAVKKTKKRELKQVGGTLSEITEAIKNSIFNKGLGPDCFDGNILQLSELLCSKVSLEIMDALNQGDIPDYLRVGRMVPL